MEEAHRHQQHTSSHLTAFSETPSTPTATLHTRLHYLHHLHHLHHLQSLMPLLKILISSTTFGRRTEFVQQRIELQELTKTPGSR